MTDVRLRANGLLLAASAYGDPDAPPAVLLHGGGQTRHAWGSAGSSLAAEGWYALSVDLRGHGDSDWAPDGDYSMDAFAGDVADVARSARQPPLLVGASLGGLSALTAVGECDDDRLARGLVLVDVTPRVEQSGTERIRAFMAGGAGGFDTLEEAADAVSAYLPNRPRPADLSGLRKNLRTRDGRWYWHWDPAFIQGRSGVDGQPGMVNHERLVGAARQVCIPVLLVRGRMSDIVSEEGVQELRELVPHAEVVDVAGAGHMVAGDRNDAFNDAVLDFARRCPP